MFKKSISLLLILFVVLFAAVGCGGNDVNKKEAKNGEQVKEKDQKITKKEKYGGTFKGRLASDPPTLDPAHATDTTSSRVIRNIFDGLVQYNKDLEIVPAIAKSWDVSKDGLTWTFNLRKDVTFHNGNKVTAEDVIYSFTRIVDPDTMSERAGLFEDVKGVEAYQNGKADKVSGFKKIDKYTVRIQLKRPFTPFLQVLAMENASIVSKEAVKKYGDQFSQHPVGTGPFKFTSWKHDSKVVLEKFEDYYVDGRPYLDKVEYKVIADNTTAFASYEQGSIYQMDSDIPSGQVERIMDPNGEFADDYSLVNRLGTYYLGFNTQKAPFDNPKVRKALNYAVNRQVIAQVLRHGTVKPAQGILPPGMPGYNPDLEGYTFNMKKAKKLLAEAGYPNGLPGTYELAYNTSKSHQKIAVAVQRNLKELGVDVKLVNTDWGTYINKVDKGDTQIFRLGWIADYPDPDNFLYVLFHSDNAGSGGNYSFYKNPAVDKLLEKARRMKPGKERLELYQKIEKKIMDDAPWIPVYYYSTHVLVKPFVHGYTFTPQTPLELTDVWLDPSHQ
ncbi:ABC-type dipeptide transport system, periplasmic component [Halobacteroides halobius DSM 5150]|uniref:ABC-type dipeptide transport system, periplasmic component n=1 Tax=Halobacteroides halobius (strain ATCC 35273 / DSM 5150 / MD-1) TaxID=748449 RepID=L0K7V5_HALHC|nr:ABC transporter substrate-binding protein [Halobacteroides halobius]AGB40434.1 ABC-type dipeptide transport system, periplasmic component [Halobacteroides halobius DSM 5150]